MKHPVIEVIESIERIYEIIKPPFSLFRKKLNFVEKVKYIQNYSLETSDGKRFKLVGGEREQLIIEISEVIFGVMKTDTMIAMSEVWHPKIAIFKLFDFYKLLLNCVYFRLDDSETRLLMHYGQLATYGREWNEFTRKTRGMVVDLKTKEIVVYPHDKFHNLNEIEETERENLPDLPYEDAEKLDGSMGILYPEVDGTLRIITKGSFYSEQSQFATEVLYDRFKHQASNFTKELLKKYTFVFEIIYANNDANRIVVDYGTNPDLRLIGMRNMETLEMLSYAEVIEWANKLGFPTVNIETMDLDKMLEEKETRTNFEGWVRRYENGLFVKVKCAEYLEHHGAKYGSSEKGVWRLLREDKWDDFIANVPEEFSPTAKMIHKKLTDFINAKTHTAHKIYSSLPQIENRKEFAQYVLENVEKEYIPFIFQLKDGAEINYLKTVISWAKFRDAINQFYNEE